MSNTDTKGFRDRLVAAQTVSPDLKEKHELEIKKMLERKLGTVSQVIISVVAAGSLGIAVWLSILAATMSHLPEIARFGLAGGAVFAVLWLVLCARILRKGSINLRFDDALMNGLAWFMTLGIAIVLFVGSGDKPGPVGTTMMLTGIFWLIIGSVFIITYRVGASELNTRIKLMELELKLAEIQELMRR